MKILALMCLAILLIAMLNGASAAGETFRCGSKIVKIGMMMDEVRKYCGEPTSTEVVFILSLKWARSVTSAGMFWEPF